MVDAPERDPQLSRHRDAEEVRGVRGLAPLAGRRREAGAGAADRLPQGAVVVAAARAASTALPPRVRTANPASEASACGVATSPRVARVSGHRVGAVMRRL